MFIKYISLDLFIFVCCDFITSRRSRKNNAPPGERNIEPCITNQMPYRNISYIYYGLCGLHKYKFKINILRAFLLDHNALEHEIFHLNHISLITYAGIDCTGSIKLLTLSQVKYFFMTKVNSLYRGSEILHR